MDKETGIIIYQTEDVRTINEHIKSIYKDDFDKFLEENGLGGKGE